jgi:tetratricopeptide (TPR) repeat protein
MSQSTHAVADHETLLSAKAKYKERDYSGALAEYTRSIEVNPTDALAFCCRGVTYYRLGDLDQAMADYNQAIDLDPKLAIAYYRRGFLQYLTKDYLSAIADYNKSIELNPDFALAYSNRSHVYRELYGEQEAVVDLRWAAKLFRKQGNLTKYQSTMKLINEISGGDSWGSGML